MARTIGWVDPAYTEPKEAPEQVEAPAPVISEDQEEVKEYVPEKAKKTARKTAAKK